MIFPLEPLEPLEPLVSLASVLTSAATTLSRSPRRRPMPGGRRGEVACAS
jgi:hypothetical protein